MALAVAQRARAGRLGLLVLGLAVDDRGRDFAARICRTRFQTLMTSPQVVSTIWQPLP